MSQNTVIRWGIVGAGAIAYRFARDLTYVPNARIDYVWSRRHETACAYAQQFGGNACVSLQALLASEIDAVYIATLHDYHAEHALAALAAGKHVLCEKPAALNATQLAQVLTAARAAKRLFMEAMKPPFYPLYPKLQAYLAHDPIGEVRFVRAGYTMSNLRQDHRVFTLEHAGGGLLDVGIYAAFLALDWLGAPLDIQTQGRLGGTGVDVFASLNCRHEQGIAQLYCGLDLYGHGPALLSGELGYVTLHEKWWNPARATIYYSDGRRVELDVPFEGGGLNYETAHFCDLIRAGVLESPVITHMKSMQMITMLDSARATLGVRYPGE